MYINIDKQITINISIKCKYCTLYKYVYKNKTTKCISFLVQFSLFIKRTVNKIAYLPMLIGVYNKLWNLVKSIDFFSDFRESLFTLFFMFHIFNT